MSDQVMAGVGAPVTTKGVAPRLPHRIASSNSDNNSRKRSGGRAAAPILAAPAVVAACDGAIHQSTREGGWGALIRFADGTTQELGGHVSRTTNNRVELTAALELLRALAHIALPTDGLIAKCDSTYVVDGLRKHLPNWKRNGWRNAAGEPVKNQDLWLALEAAAAAVPTVRLQWVRGHDGDPDNEAADRIAVRWSDAPADDASITTGPVGSAWDLGASPDRVIPDHLTEWVEGSAVTPELAAANLQSLAGRDVLEALAGDRLEQLGGWASQYATGKVARILRPLEPIAEAGGWWVSGLDPLADWAPMDWGQFKPTRPRWNPEKGRPIKYEAPIGQPTRSAWLRVPATVAQRVADRFRLQLPAAVAADVTGDAGAFWRWLATEHRLPLLITEGAKKAGALLSAGMPAVALPGVDNGAKRTGEKDPTTGRRTGPAELLPDLSGLSWTDRQALVLFDWSDSERGRRDVSRAARRLGYHLRRAGAAAVRIGICPGPHKGADDHLAAGGSLDQLLDALEPLGQPPATPHLRAADQVAPAGFLADGVDLAALGSRRLIAIAAPMGAGKTRLARELMAPHLADGVPILAPTHRTSLGEASTAAVGIPWAAAPGSVERLQGLGLCWDSLRPTSSLRIHPPEWASSVLLLDEIAQGIEHLLFGTGTAVADHRPTTMATTGALLQQCHQALAMDAQLADPVLRLLETLAGERFHLLQSAHRPMAGRRVVVPQGLTARTAAEQGRGHVLQLAKARKRALVVTTAQQAHTKGSAQNLAALVRRQWPGVRVLVVDSEHQSAAEQLGADPNGVAAAHDWIIASPSITSGLSIDQAGLFDETVVIGAGGRLTCEHLAQAAARVRDPRCPVTIYAPAIAPKLRIASGATSPSDLLRHLAACEARLLADLVGAAGWEPSATNESPWLRCWLELAAHRNRQSFAYSTTIAALLEAEGWAVDKGDAANDPVAVAMASVELNSITEQAIAVADEKVINSPAISDKQAAALRDKQRLTPDERAQLQRHRIAQRWGLGDAPPTPELLAADREGLNHRLRFAWILQDKQFRKLAAEHDRRRAAQLTANGAWAPDLVRELMGHKLAAADELGLPQLLQSRDWISDTDLEKDWQLREEAPQPGETLEQEAQRRIANQKRGERRQLLSVLGIAPGARASGTLRSVLKLCGFGLASRRTRCGNGRRGWQYKLVPIVPDGADLQKVATAWAEQLTQGGV